MERLLLMPGARAPLLPLFEPGDPLNRNLRSPPKLRCAAAPRSGPRETLLGSWHAEQGGELPERALSDFSLSLSYGTPHYQTKHKGGHTFWGPFEDLLDFLLPGPFMVFDPRTGRCLGQDLPDLQPNPFDLI